MPQLVQLLSNAKSPRRLPCTIALLSRGSCCSCSDAEIVHFHALAMERIVGTATKRDTALKSQLLASTSYIHMSPADQHPWHSLPPDSLLQLLESIVNVVVEGSTARKLQPRRGLHNSGAACTKTPGAGSLSQAGAPVGAMISPGAAHPLTAGRRAC